MEIGYVIPLTLECIKNLKDAEVYPVGIQNQDKINEKGDIIPKKRVANDRSLNSNKVISVN